MFTNFEFLFGKEISLVARNICAKMIQTHGGKIAKRPKFPSRFKRAQAYTPLNPTLTHILVNDQSTREVDLCNDFYCLGIPSNVKVVHWSWLEACTRANAVCDISPYQVTKSSGPAAAANKRGVKRGFDPTTASANPMIHPPATITPTVIPPVPVAPTIVVAPTRPPPPPVVVAPIVSVAAPPAPPPAPSVPAAKRGKAGDFDCIDAYNNSFASPMVQSMGNGWYLLHNMIDGDRTPSLLFKFSSVQRPCTSVVGFDMDGTIILTKSGATFAKDASDWKFLYNDIPSQLSVRHQSGAHLFIVSNQNGVNKGHVTVSQLMTKFDDIVNQIGVPMDIACAFANDVYRKPRTGAWEFLARNRFVDFATDSATRLSILGQSMYVGDAAGRPKTRDRVKDFSASDYKMSVNYGIQFQTPEQFFRDSRAPIDCDRSAVDLGFSLRDYLRQNPPQPIDPTIFDVPSPSVRLEIILLIGPPACGKSTIARRLEASGNCVRVNQDTLKTRPACLKAARSILSSGKSVIVDNTNSNRTQRADWISLGREFSGVTLRCIRIDMDKELCFHMISYRLANEDTPPEDRREIPGVAVHTFYKRVEEPTVSEGFTRVDRIPFVPRDPPKPESVALLYSYLA